MKKRSLSKSILPILAFVLILVAGVGFYQAQRKVTNLVPVLVAASTIEPYSIVADSQVKFVDMPEASIDPENDITKEQFDELFIDSKKAMFVSQQVLPGQRIDQRIAQAIDNGNATTGTMAAVSADERVIGVSATVSSSILGKLRAGDVIDVVATSNTGGSSGASTSFAKVLCVSEDPNECRIRASSTATKDDSATTTATKGNINLLLSVVENDAVALAGQPVAVSLNPFCHVNIKPDGTKEAGDFTGSRCTVPGSRAASANVTSDAANEEDAAGAAGDEETSDAPADGTEPEATTPAEPGNGDNTTNSTGNPANGGE